MLAPISIEVHIITETSGEARSVMPLSLTLVLALIVITLTA